MGYESNLGQVAYSQVVTRVVLMKTAAAKKQDSLECDVRAKK